jgi:BlaI family penicillinase repressor
VDNLENRKSIAAALSKGLGPLEMEVLDVIWEMGEATSREIFEKMRERKKLGQSTVLTVLRRLSDRGILKRDAGGDVYRYSPVVPRHELGGKMVDDIVNRIFQGSVEPVIAHLISRSDIKGLDVERLKQLQDELNKE